LYNDLASGRRLSHHSILVADPAGSRIHHVAIRVADPAASLAFYSGALGLPEVRRFDEGGRLRSIWVRAGDAVIMLEREIKGGGPGDGSGHVLVLEVDDLERWVARLSAAGHAPLARTTSTVYYADPDGHRVGLSVYPRGELTAAERG
jgi:catechol 2,3-dioxygenase-like lactoylglutathione lyase family enzyme